MIDLRQERYESVPEFVREPQTASREKAKASIISALKRDWTSNKKPAYNTTAYSSTATTTRSATSSPIASTTYEDLEFGGLEEDFMHPKSAELETLWPGLDQNFLHVDSQRGPSFYLTLGFLGGAVMSLAGLWVYAWLTHSSFSYTAPNLASAKKLVVTAGIPTSNKSAVHSTSAHTAGNAEVTTLIPTSSNTDLVVPAFSTYEVKTGDTLAVIAAKAYHRVSPRLLDAICRANGMRSADVLALGQKVNLPEYRPTINQFPATR